LRLRQSKDALGMTIPGVLNKSLILLALVFVVFILVAGLILNALAPWAQSWNAVVAQCPRVILPYVIVALIAGGAAVVRIFLNKEYTMLPAIVFAAAEGVLLGAVAAFCNIWGRGLEGLAGTIFLTFGVLLIFLVAQKKKIIRTTKLMRRIFLFALLGIASSYLVGFLLTLVRIRFPYIHEYGIGGVLLGVFFVFMAVFNLVFDFDCIERGRENNPPKDMEWFSAFALVLVLVWVYFQLLWLFGRLMEHLLLTSAFNYRRRV